MPRRRRILPIAGLLGLLAIGVAGASVRAAAPDRACSRWASADGSARYRSVQALVDALRPSEVGCLRAGVYREDVTIRHGGTRGRPVVLRSAPGARATLLGALWIPRTATDVTIRGLWLDGSTTGGKPSPQVNGRRVVFDRDDITNRHTGICLALGGAFEQYGRAVDTVVERSRIHGCGRLPRTGHDHGIYVEGSIGARIVDDVIVDNADWGVHLYPEADRTYVAHNLIAENGGGIIVAGEDARGEYARAHTSDDNLIEENVIAYSAGHNLETYWGSAVGSGNVARDNCLWSAGAGNLGDTAGLTVVRSLIANPQLLDPAHGLFRMGAHSRCRSIGAGPR